MQLSFSLNWRGFEDDEEFGSAMYEYEMEYQSK